MCEWPGRMIREEEKTKEISARPAQYNFAHGRPSDNLSEYMTRHTVRRWPMRRVPTALRTRGQCVAQTETERYRRLAGTSVSAKLATARRPLLIAALIVIIASSLASPAKPSIGPRAPRHSGRL